FNQAEHFVWATEWAVLSVRRELKEESNMLETAADTRIQNVLSRLDKALVSRDIEAALELFVDQCHWRDFLAFTWNLKTVAGKSEIRDMLEQCLDRTQPTTWQVDENEMASHADGVTEGFIEFDT